MLFHYVLVMENDFSIGAELVKYAQSLDPIERIAPVTRLFPYIYEASKKMGVREISRWLLLEKKISISPATISRALRAPANHWEDFASIVELHVRALEEQLKVHVSIHLFDLGPEELLCVLEGRFKELDTEWGKDKEGRLVPHSWLILPRKKGKIDRFKGNGVQEAFSFLIYSWYPLDFHTRFHCRDYLMQFDSPHEGPPVEERKESEA